jgi:hypothetical protein
MRGRKYHDEHEALRLHHRIIQLEEVLGRRQDAVVLRTRTSRVPKANCDSAATVRLQCWAEKSHVAVAHCKEEVVL